MIKHKSFSCIIVAACLAVISFNPAFAANKSNNIIDIENFEADYYLSKDKTNASQLHVSEEITVNFPNTDLNHGLERFIPRTNQDGRNLTIRDLNALNLKIYHNGILEDPSKVDKDSKNFSIRIGNKNEYVHGKHVYRLEYDLTNVITSFNNETSAWQELYLDTNGTGWTAHFDQIIARIHFDSTAIAENFTGESWCYVGSYGDNDQSRCTTTKIDRGLEFSATNLSPYENLTFVLKFQPETFTIPKPSYDYRFLILSIILAISIIIFSMLYLHFYHKASKNHKYYKNLFEKPEYTPPVNFTVAEMFENYLKKHQLRSRTVATLIELAVNHKIEIIKNSTKTTKRSKFEKISWQIEIKSLNLSKEQLQFLKIINGKDEELKLNQIIKIEPHNSSASLAKMSNNYQKSLEEKLIQQKLKVASPKSFEITTAATMIFYCIFILVTIFFVLDASESTALQVIGGMLLGIINVVVAIVAAIVFTLLANSIEKYSTHTKLGLDYSYYLNGLKLYIKMAEKDRLNFLQSVDGADISSEGIIKLYEKLLPYAIIFGQEESWTKELSRYYEQNSEYEPTWYHGDSIYNAALFTAAIHSFDQSVQVSSASTNMSTSSSSSGSFGGGFSGGGAGGGGGGGW